MALRVKAAPLLVRWLHPVGTAINIEILEPEDMGTEITVDKTMAMEDLVADTTTPEGLLASAARPYLRILESRRVQ